MAGDALLGTHVADFRALSDTMSIDLGSSTAAQRAMDTWSRLQARAAGGGTPDPELEASYLQFGRYLTITGSRDGLPLSLQGPWLETNSPAWMSDYHTDINIEMNYWLTDRAGLSSCFDALANYCLSQLPCWTQLTKELFLDQRNRYRNTSGKVDGWAIAFSTNIYGGLGWWWHPAGNAWLCLSLWQHFEFTQDLGFLRKIYPLLKGAAQFWVARLITTTITDPLTGSRGRCWSTTTTGRRSRGRRTPSASPTRRNWCGCCSGTCSRRASCCTRTRPMPTNSVDCGKSCICPW